MIFAVGIIFSCQVILAHKILMAGNLHTYEIRYWEQVASMITKNNDTNHTVV